MAKPDLTTYGGLLRDLGYAGDRANLNPMSTIQLINENALAIQYGQAVARGAADDTCKPPSLDTDIIIGFALRQPTTAADPLTSLTSYPQFGAVPVMREGDMIAVPFENVKAGDDVLSITAQKGLLGGTTSGAAGAGRVAVPGAVWDTTTPAGMPGKIRANTIN